METQGKVWKFDEDWRVAILLGVKSQKSKVKVTIE